MRLVLFAASDDEVVECTLRTLLCGKEGPWVGSELIVR